MECSICLSTCSRARSVAPTTDAPRASADSPTCAWPCAYRTAKRRSGSEGWEGDTRPPRRCNPPHIRIVAPFHSGRCVVLSQMPSRQERRQASRDAAKRAATAAREPEPEHVDVVPPPPPAPVADWTTQAEDPKVLFRTLGAKALRHKAGGHTRVPFPLILSLLSPFPLNLSPLYPHMTQVKPWMCPEGAQDELQRERCVPKVPKLSSEVSECISPWHKAAAGDMEAQFSLGAVLSEVCEVAAAGAGTPLGAAGLSVHAQVRSMLCMETFPVDHLWVDEPVNDQGKYFRLPTLGGGGRGGGGGKGRGGGGGGDGGGDRGDGGDGGGSVRCMRRGRRRGTRRRAVPLLRSGVPRHLRRSHGRGLHSFPFPLNFSLLCPFPLKLSLLCPPFESD